MTAFEDFSGAANSPAGSAIIGAGGGMISAGIAGKFAQKAAKVANAFSERMSNTAMQRRAVDLEAAGMNRMLAIGGPGAAAPTGQMAQTPDFGLGVRGAQSGLAAYKAGEEKKLIRAQTAHHKESTKLEETKQLTERFLQGVHSAQSLKSTQEAIRTNWETRIIAHKLPRARAEAGPYVQYPGLMQKKLRLDHGINTAQGASNVYRTLMGGGKDSMQLLKLFKMIQGM